MFDFDHKSIGLKHGVSTNDPAAVISAAASSLMRQVDRLLTDHNLSSAVPSAGEILSDALPILVIAQGKTCSDADIVELGMDFNPLQWHVDAVRHQIGEATMGELTGLFSSLQMFLTRFKSWRDFESTPGVIATTDSETFGIAVALLKGARDARLLLTPEANLRIEMVLERASAHEAPGQHEGVVRSGENLAAITAERLSRITVERATSNFESNGPGEAMVE
jgi:hypothetical protein